MKPSLIHTLGNQMSASEFIGQSTFLLMMQAAWSLLGAIIITSGILDQNNMHLYSEKYELHVRLSTPIDDGSIALIETNGFTDTILSRFVVFEHMMKSVKINR